MRYLALVLLLISGYALMGCGEKEKPRRAEHRRGVNVYVGDDSVDVYVRPDDDDDDDTDVHVTWPD